MKNQSIYLQGVDAFSEGLTMEDNPYIDTVEHLQWYWGWSDADEAAFYNRKGEKSE